MNKECFFSRLFEQVQDLNKLSELEIINLIQLLDSDLCNFGKLNQ